MVCIFLYSHNYCTFQGILAIETNDAFPTPHNLLHGI